MVMLAMALRSFSTMTLLGKAEAAPRLSNDQALQSIDKIEELDILLLEGWLCVVGTDFNVAHQTRTKEPCLTLLLHNLCDFRDCQYQKLKEKRPSLKISRNKSLDSILNIYGFSVIYLVFDELAFHSVHIPW